MSSIGGHVKIKYCPIESNDCLLTPPNSLNENNQKMFQSVYQHADLLLKQAASSNMS